MKKYFFHDIAYKDDAVQGPVIFRELQRLIFENQVTDLCEVCGEGDLNDQGEGNWTAYYDFEPEEEPVYCPSCSTAFSEMPALGDLWHCSTCNTDFKEEMVFVGWTAAFDRIVSGLEDAIDAGSDYVELESTLRDAAKKMSDYIMLKPLKLWIERDVQLYRMWFNFPGRQQYLSIKASVVEADAETNSSALKKINDSLRTLCELSNAQVQAMGGVTKNLGTIKVGTTMAGALAAKELGEHIGGMLD